MNRTQQNPNTANINRTNKASQLPPNPYTGVNNKSTAAAKPKINS